MPLARNHPRGPRTTEATGESKHGAMMNPFFRTPPSDEEERKVARAITWLALLLCTVVLLLAAVLAP